MPTLIGHATVSVFARSLALSEPESAQAGDLLVAIIGRSWDLGVTPPLGWTEMLSIVNGGQQQVWVFTRAATGGTDVPYRWTFPGSNQWCYSSLTAWRGAMFKDSAANVSDSTTVSVPSLTSTAGNVLLAAAANWVSTTKDFNDADAMTRIAHLSRGWLVERQTLAGSPSPSYVCTASSSGRMTGVAILLSTAGVNVSITVPRATAVAETLDPQVSALQVATVDGSPATATAQAHPPTVEIIDSGGISITAITGPDVASRTTAGPDITHRAVTGADIAPRTITGPSTERVLTGPDV